MADIMPAQQPLRSIFLTNRASLVIDKESLTKKLERVTKMLELIEANPAIEEFLVLLQEK